MRGSILPSARWRRRRLARRVLVAALMLTGVLAAAADLGQRSGGTLIVVAAREMPGGTVIGDADLATTRIQPGTALAGVGLEADDVVGRTTIATVAAGEMLTASRLVGTEEAPSTKPGTTAMPVVFDEPALIGFLQPGMVVDLLWTDSSVDGSVARTVAAGARVLTVPQPEGGGPFVGAGAAAGPVLMEIPRSQALSVAAAMGGGSLSLALHDGQPLDSPTPPPQDAAEPQQADPAELP